MNSKKLKKIILLTCALGIAKYAVSAVILTKLLDIGAKRKPKAK